MNSEPSGSASMNSQFVVDMWECTREYPEYAAGDQVVETGRGVHNDEHPDPSGVVLGVLGGSSMSARGPFRYYTPFQQSLPFGCEF